MKFKTDVKEMNRYKQNLKEQNLLSLKEHIQIKIKNLSKSHTHIYIYINKLYLSLGMLLQQTNNIGRQVIDKIKGFQV